MYALNKIDTSQVFGCFKGPGHYLVITQSVSIKNLPSNEQRRAVDSIKHCEKRLPLSYIVFEEEVNVIHHSKNM